MNTFRVFAGQVKTDDDSKQKSLGGSAPALASWNGTGGFLNQLTPDGVTAQEIATGGFRDYSIEGRQGATYLSVVQDGNDGICIHLITGQSAGVGLQYFWTGDMAVPCGVPWYQQSQVIASEPSGYTPACIWIDGNGDRDHDWKGFNVHLNSFPLLADRGPNSRRNKTAKAFRDNQDLLCKSEPRFSMYKDIKIGNQIRTYNEDPTAEDPGTQAYADKTLQPDNWRWGDKPPAGKLPMQQTGRTVFPMIVCVDNECLPEGPSFHQGIQEQPQTRRKRQVSASGSLARPMHDSLVASIKKRQQAHTNKLVISKMEQHSAITLCDSETSLGPDFVSMAEMMFCDMSEKQLWPICADAAASYCFDTSTEAIRGTTVTLDLSSNAPHSDTTAGTSAKILSTSETDDSSAAQPSVPA